MADYISYNTEMIQALTEAIRQGAKALSGSSAEDEMVESLIDLVNGLPYYRSPEWNKAHRETLATLLAINCSNAEIAEPDLDAGYIFNSWSDYKTYREAFYHGVKGNSATERVYVLLSLAQLDESYWRSYNTCLLTDAMRKAYNVYVSDSEVDSDLRRYHDLMMPSLQHTVRGVFEYGYEPISQPFAALQATGKALNAAQLLDRAIHDGLFTNNVNAVMNNPPDGPTSATWLLYCLWNALNILGYGHGTIDAAIPQYEAEGLIVPREIRTGNWWQGEYTYWYIPLSGNDIISPAPGMVKKTMPCGVYYSNAAWVQPILIYAGLEYGFSVSFCELGSCARYYTGTERNWPWD